MSIKHKISPNSLANLKHFKKGVSANPKGRPKGSVDFFTQVRDTMKKVEKEKGISLIEYAVRKAYTNPQVLIAILKKVIPDMSQSEIKVKSPYEEYENMSDEELIKDFEQEFISLKSFITEGKFKDN